MAAEVAEPEDSVTIPREVPPLKNSTDPVAVPAPGETGATVAVNVTDCPKTEGFTEDVNAVVVFATMLATWTALPLLIAFVVTTAVRLPRDGAVLKVTVNWVAVALVTVPVPLLKVTVLLAAVVSKPVPVMIRVVAVAARLLVFEVIEGPEPIVAVCPVKARLFKITLTVLGD
jgi:hypothetical protein